MISILKSPDLRPEEVAARLLMTPSALEGLTRRDAVRIVSYMRPKVFPAGAVIIHEGEQRRNDHMLLILEGDVAVESAGLGDEDEMVVEVMGPGCLIGEMGMLDGEPRSATCKAITEVMTAVLTRAALTRLLKENPALGARLLLAISKRLSDHLRATTRKLRNFTRMNLALQQELLAVMNRRGSLAVDAEDRR